MEENRPSNTAASTSPPTSPAVARALAAVRHARALLVELVADAPYTALADNEVVALLEAAEEGGRLVDAARTGLTAQVMVRTAVAPGQTVFCQVEVGRLSVDFPATCARIPAI